MQRGLPERRKIKDVAKVIAVSSAKGGVGKSTVAGMHGFSTYTLSNRILFASNTMSQALIKYLANLSLAFARQGHRTGILDTDIFGPSIPTLFNLSGEPRLSSSQSLCCISYSYR